MGNKAIGGYEEMLIATTQAKSRTDEIVSFFEEVTSSQEQSNVVISNISNNSENIRNISEKLLESAKKGREYSNEGIENILRLQEQAKHFDEILFTLKKIAKIINYSSINLRIKAAHLGKNDSEFTVISNEICDLYDETTENIKIIKDINKEFKLALQNTITKSKEIDYNFQEVEEHADTTVKHISEITTALHEQSASNRQILGSMSNMVESISEVKDVLELIVETNQEALENAKGESYAVN